MIKLMQYILVVSGLCLAIFFFLCMGYACTPTQQDNTIFNTSPQMDTVEVITEDGIRWYTLDTIIYEK
tara:strand:+ start:344 stop:547 length:204 start_codon:yes stop_codon:yes gene_type:complete